MMGGNYNAVMQAMNGIQGAIDRAAGYYSQATDKVTQMAKDINNQNVGVLKDTTNQAMSLLNPFIKIGQQGAAALNNILGVNGQASQMQAIQGMIKAGNMDQQNLQTLQSIFGSSGNTPMESVLQSVTGVSNPGQAAANIINANPTDYANQLTKAGVQNAQDATSEFADNGFVQQSLNQMNSLGQRAVQNSAAANGTLNSGRTMQALYNQGQGIAGQYLLPQMGNIYNSVLGSTTSSGNAMLGAQSSLANQIVGSGTQLAGQLANSMLQANTSMAGNILSNTTSGLSSMASIGGNAANAGAGALASLGGSIAGQNSQMGSTISNATMANAQNMGQAAMAGAQLQLQMAQMMRPSGW